jgi:Sulfotransferase domain
MMSNSRYRNFLRRLTKRGSAGSESSQPRPIPKTRAEALKEYRQGQPDTIVFPPPPCPEGWEIGPPTYIGVGVQKAGTTWWSRAISLHPDVLKPVRKELQYFEHFWNVEVDEHFIIEYHKYFPRHDGKVTGEWSPRYMLDPWTAQRIHQASPDARILVMLRDPMKVLVSGLRMAIRRLGSPHPRVLMEAIQRGRYAEQLGRFARYYDRNQILVLQFERCLQSPEAEYARTLEFIGLDSSFVPADLKQPVNQGRGPDVTLPSDIVDLALETYRSDVVRLRSDWPEIDVDLWKSLR